jgi:TonB family protein
MKIEPWPSLKVLSNSVVDVAVNGAGHVIACRLAAPSDSKEADHAALQKAKLLRFRPLNAIGTIWGQAIFEWATTEPAEAKQK